MVILPLIREDKDMGLKNLFGGKTLPEIEATEEERELAAKIAAARGVAADGDPAYVAHVCEELTHNRYLIAMRRGF